MLKIFLKSGKLSRSFLIFVCPLGEKFPAWASHSWSRPTRPRTVGEYEYCLLNITSVSTAQSVSCTERSYWTTSSCYWFDFSFFLFFFPLFVPFFFSVLTIFFGLLQSVDLRRTFFFYCYHFHFFFFFYCSPSWNIPYVWDCMHNSGAPRARFARAWAEPHS